LSRIPVVRRRRANVHPADYFTGRAG
jgi:hypothetical protein